MRILYLALLIVCAAVPAQLRAASNTILLVVSGYGVAGDKTRPGFEMDELSQAWTILRANGLDVEIASPQGGKVGADRYDAAKPYNAAFLADPKAVAALAATLPVATAAARTYAGVFVMGGKGAMHDSVRPTPESISVSQDATGLSQTAVDLARLFDLLPEDRIIRAMANNAASTAILGFLEKPPVGVPINVP